jgi:ABC-2 type transport system permease protein
MQTFFDQLIYLVLIQLTNWRWSWRGTIVLGMVAPVFLILAFGAFAGNSPEAAGYVLTGNLVMSLLLEGLGKVSSHFSFIRVNGMLDYFATLPIYRGALILATVIAFLIMSLPSVIVTLILGTVILKIPLALSPWVLLVVPLVSLSLSGLGALIGLMSRTPDEVNSISTITTFLLFGFGPVLIPADRLPEIITTVSLISPATYAASALRQVVLGQADRIPLMVDVLVLVVVTLGFLWLVIRRLDWRGRQ